MPISGWINANCTPREWVRGATFYKKKNKNTIVWRHEYWKYLIQTPQRFTPKITTPIRITAHHAHTVRCLSTRLWKPITKRTATTHTHTHRARAAGRRFKQRFSNQYMVAALITSRITEWWRCLHRRSNVDGYYYAFDRLPYHYDGAHKGVRARALSIGFCEYASVWYARWFSVRSAHHRVLLAPSARSM